MSETTEARAWGRDNGWDVSVKGPLPSGLMEAWQARADTHQDYDDGEPPIVITAPVLSEPSAETDAAPPAAGTPPRRPETPPAGRKVNVADRFRQRNTTAAKKRTRPRVSIEDLVQGAWALAGFGLTRVEAMVPVGRVVMWQSGFAGVVAEDKLKGTAIDKALQPLARAGEQGKVVMGLVGPPVLVGIMCQNPELAPVVQPFLRMALASCMELAGPAIEKAQRKQEKMAESLGDFDPDALIEAFFADLPSGPVSPEEEAAIRRAADGNR